MRIRNKTYDIWYNMKRRCLDPTHDRFCDYGAKGITVSEDWLSFENFKRDMGERPEGKTLDRIKNTLGYSKENCRWATPTQQTLNKGVRKDSSTKVRGVAKHKLRDKWRAYGTIEGVTITLYYGSSFEEAVVARRAWEAKNVT